MPRTCIITDSTACFTKPTFAGHEYVTVLLHTIQLDDLSIPDSKNLSIYTAPANGHHPLAFAPSVDMFRTAFSSLSREYKDIVVVLLSSQLSQAYQNALAASNLWKTSANIFVIDSLNTAIGLGLLVQAAAEYAHRGFSGVDINRLVRGMVNHIYSVFCLPDLSHLYRSGLIDPAQAIVGEMLGIIPFFTLESGKLVHTQKIRSPRHLVDILFEFVAEFENLKYLAVLQGVSAFGQESRNLHERISQYVRSTPLCEHSMSLSLATILGPHCIGLVAMENITKEA